MGWDSFAPRDASFDPGSPSEDPRWNRFYEDRLLDWSSYDDGCPTCKVRRNLDTQAGFTYIVCPKCYDENTGDGHCLDFDDWAEKEYERIGR